MSGIEVRFVGAGRVTRALLRAADGADEEVEQAIAETASGAVRIFRRFAPKRTGRLHRGILAFVSGLTGRVEAHARNPESGFDYVGVTRFGHSVARIYPKRAKALGPIPGIGFRASVRGYKPAGDWAERALPFIAVTARGALRGAARRVAARV